MSSTAQARLRRSARSRAREAAGQPVTDFDLDRAGARMPAVGAPAGRTRALGGALPGAGIGRTDVDQDIHFLIRRATHGFSVASYREALGLGYVGWLDWQLDHENIDDTAVDQVLAGFGSLGLTSSELITQYPTDPGPVVVELQEAALLRAIYSRKQLFERMVEFWSDHFNISQLDDLALWWKTADDRETIRAHAFGTFPDMLRASSRSTCMMWYLDNFANVAGSAQENWARELLELHTLGVDGPYTETDVREVARCFTGWTFHGVFTAGPLGEWTYVNGLHDQGPKTVLGHAIPAGGGMQDGETVLDILAMHPKTAEFISTKMARFLLAYEPPADLIQRLQGIYLQTGGSIKPMIREILRPESVASVVPAERAKLKRPFGLVVGLMRALEIDSTDLLQLTLQLQRLGHVPFWWPAPNGYPDNLGAWGPAVLPRWEFCSRITAFAVPGNQALIQILLDLLKTAPPGATRVADQIDWVLTGGTLSPAEVATVQAFLDSQPGSGLVLREAFALAASSPSYQFH